MSLVFELPSLKISESWHWVVSVGSVKVSKSRVETHPSESIHSAAKDHPKVVNSGINRYLWNAREAPWCFAFFLPPPPPPAWRQTESGVEFTAMMSRIQCFLFYMNSLAFNHFTLQSDLLQVMDVQPKSIIIRKETRRWIFHSWRLSLGQNDRIFFLGGGVCWPRALGAPTVWKFQG